MPKKKNGFKALFENNLKIPFAALVILIYGAGFFTAATIYYYETSIEKPVAVKNLIPLPVDTYSAKINVVAVKSSGGGALSQAEVEVREGKGRVLFSINPFVEPDTQQSAETAVSVAEKFTGKSLNKMDVIYTITPPEPDTKLIGGPSAGAALTIATIAAIEGKQVREDAAITGTINADGSIGKIGGVIEKAKAAADKNKTLFLVPKRQSILTVYEKQVTEEKKRGWVIQRINYVPKELNLNDYLQDLNYSMQVKEVSNIKEAIQFMID